jgi:hypothetical protein
MQHLPQQKFHTDHHMNQLLLDGDWRQVYHDNLYTANKVLALIVEYYELGEDIAQALCLQ